MIASLTDLGLSLNGKTGVAAIPVQLHGEAEFDGTVSGSLIAPDVKGRLMASNFSTDLTLADFAWIHHNTSPHRQTIHWDRLDATAEYSPSLISIQRAVLTRGAAKIDIRGTLAAHAISRHRTEFDDFSAIDATASIHQTPVTDLTAIAGQSVPVTGTVNLQVHAGGTLGNLTGGGDIQIQGGEIAGEPYHNATANLSFAGRQLNLVRLTLRQDGGTADRQRYLRSRNEEVSGQSRRHRL